ncbi:MAG: glycosyltransferase family 4 protein [Candidatus Blackburnbacteria bacterium]|nr:glycosyltransferase family 4 protein [Candidatus Blackburnbacteria bacterium]
MRIAIDVSPVVYETGVSYYTKNLVNALLQLNEEDEFVLFGGALRRKGELDNFVNSLRQKNVRKRTFFLPPSALSFVWNDLHKFPIENFTGSLNVFHSSDWTQPPTSAYKVTTIHDLVPLRFPEISHPKIVETHKKRLSWVVKEVDKIIAVSTFTKDEIVGLLGIEPKRIVVIPEAADPGLVPVSRERVRRVIKNLGLTRDYLLVVGADPRKNIPAIIQAFGKIRKEADLDLVITGRFWEDVPKEPGIIALGHMPREDLRSLYAGAQALVYTSLYEGFGLPILEAMQLGCPVVTSNISSMPEVAGEAAVLVDPTNPTVIASGIEKVLSEREIWIEKGLGRAKEFSWENTAKLTFKVYKEGV